MPKDNSIKDSVHQPGTAVPTTKNSLPAVKGAVTILPLGKPSPRDVAQTESDVYDGPDGFQGS
jgi:hypothetical protein